MSSPDVLPVESLGLRALAVAIGEIGVREPSRRVREYLSGCERGGRVLSLTSGPWCASFVGWCEREAGVAALPWRGSVAELCADAYARGMWSPLDGGARPLPGDLAIFRRGGQDPTLGGFGHVGRVESLVGDDLTTIDGNHGDAVARVVRSLRDPALLGWILLPRVTTGIPLDALARGAAEAGLDRETREALGA